MSESINILKDKNFSYDNCFLCGIELNDSNRSDEHVYPKWLQHEFKLWNKQLILLNGTQIQYKNLVIPCCKACNNELLSNRLEKPIQTAFENGVSGFRELDEGILFQWFVKLSYGILFKELSLAVNRRNPDEGTIMTPEILDHYDMLHSFLQSIRFDTKFEFNKPWSILIFDIENIEDEMVYDAQDLILINCFFMRLGNIGIIANLQDNGLNKEFYLEHYSETLNNEIASNTV